MWPWTDPVREMLRVFLNRTCAPYIENHDSERVNSGIASGLLVLNDLRLKRIKLENSALPFVISEGYLGRLTVSIPWTLLGSRPVEILVEDIYILVTPRTPNVDPGDEERRAQAVKAKKLKNSESFRVKRKTDDTSLEKQGFIASLIMKLVNKLQVTVKNVHIRYEDDVDHPGRPFAAGISLAEFTACSVDENWKSNFVRSGTGSIHKLASLTALAVYLDPNAITIARLPAQEAINKLTSLMSSGDHELGHQYILRPVYVECRLTVNKKKNGTMLNKDVKLLLPEVTVTLNDRQYGAVILLIDRYSLNLRRRKYRRDAPNHSALERNRPQALFRFAACAVLREIHEQNRMWTFAYIKEIGEKRRCYMTLFRKKLLTSMRPEDKLSLETLECALSYEDIELYRVLTRFQIYKDVKAGKLPKNLKLKKTRFSGASIPRSWSLDWLMITFVHHCSSSDDSRTPKSTSNPNLWNLTNEQRKVLYEAVDYDQAAVTHRSTPDAVELHMAITLERGTFTLRSSQEAKATDIISVVFDELMVDTIRRPDSFEVTLALGRFGVFDGSTTDSAYPQVVGVQDSGARVGSDPSERTHEDSDQVLYIKFKNKPLDQRADTELIVRLRCMEVIYHKGYIEATYRFFNPPQITPETFETLSAAASNVFNQPYRKAVEGFKHIMTTHDTLNLTADLQAPKIILPENIASKQSQHLVLYAGNITIESNIASDYNKQGLDEKIYNDSTQSVARPYQYFSLKTEGTQLLLGPDMASCLKALKYPDAQSPLHIIERTNLEIRMQKFMFSSPPASHVGISRLPRVKVSSRLPRLQVNMSDTKYNAIKQFIIAAIPTFKENSSTSNVRADRPASCNFMSPCFASNLESCCQGDDDSDEEWIVNTEAGGLAQANDPQQAFELDFALDVFLAHVSKINLQGVEKLLGKILLEGFHFTFAVAALTWTINVSLRSLAMDLEQVSNDRIVLLSSHHDDSVPEKDLRTVADTLWSAVKTTFVSEESPVPPPSFFDQVEDQTHLQKGPKRASLWSDTIRLTVDPASVEVGLINDSAPLSTMTLSTANVSVTISGRTIRSDIIQMFLVWSVAYYWQVLGRILAQAPAI